MKVDAKTADTLGWFTAIVKRPFHAEWSNYGMPDLATDYKAGEKIRCGAWKPEGMSPCKAAGHPDMWLSWKLLENCDYSAEDVARLERLTAENACAKNASFKKGEYVTSKGSPQLGKGKIIDEVDYNQYIVRFDDGDESLFEGSDLVAANACKARNYAYSTDPIKLMIQYAKKEDYGGITDFTNPEEAEEMGLYPADLVKRIYAKAMKYYAGGRNMATPAQQQELVGLLSQLKYKAANSCAKNANLKVGDRVKHSEYKTKGTVFEILPEGDIGVEWDNGGQAYYGRFHYPISMIQPSANSCGVRSTNAAVNAALNSACARNAGGEYFVWFSTYGRTAARAEESVGDVIKKVPGAKRDGANLIVVKREEDAKKAYDLFRKAGVSAKDLNYGQRAANASVAKNNSDDTQYDMEAMIRDMKRIAAWNDPKYYVKSFIEYGKHINNPESWNRPNPLVPDNALASATQALAGVGGKLGDALATIKTTFPTLVAFYKAYKKVNNL